jgi:peptidoglycan hydrolase-like protein with peptidoglycan-binding domain
MSILFPGGYSDLSPRFTLDQVRAKHGRNMHPEFERRVLAAMVAAGGLVGIGGGYRAPGTQPDKSGFAPEGRSFHQPQEWASGERAYAALDMIGLNGDHTGARAWLRDHADEFGLHAFGDVNNEPWHIQCNDVPFGWSTWKSAGSPDPGHFDLPGAVSPGLPTFDAVEGLWGLWPIAAKPTCGLANDAVSQGDAVRYLQGVIFHKAGGQIEISGLFDVQTDSRVKDLQKWFGLGVDGRVGPNTWGLIDFLSAL